jgi:hypothetical protein
MAKGMLALILLALFNCPISHTISQQNPQQTGHGEVKKCVLSPPKPQVDTASYSAGPVYWYHPFLKL